MILGNLSIRLRLTLWYTAVLIVILFVVSFGSYFFMRNRLESEARSRLESSYATVETVIRNSSGDLMDIYHLGQESLFQLARDERVVYQTLTWQDKLWAGTPTDRHFAEANSWKSSEGSLFWLKKGIESDSGFEIIVAQDVTSTMEYIKSLTVILMSGIPFALIMAVLGGYFLAGRALSPVKAVTRKASEINAENLSERLPIQNPHDEIGQLTSVFNDTLARLDSSFKQLRRFTSDASHELRTPLTSIRSVGEVALQGCMDRKSCQEAIGSMLEETERLTHLVDNLLTLARGDTEKASLTPKYMDLSVLIGEVVEELRILAEEKNQILSSYLQSSVMVTADESTLRRAVSNVLHNAIRHTQMKGHIEVHTTKTEEGTAVIDILDDGPGIPDSERTKVFERFYRVSGARSSEGGGVGLGLAIARWAVEANGGAITFLDKEGPGTHCRITLLADEGEQR
jgi:heavy metal sensor kinase